MLKALIIVIAVVIAALLVFAATRPDSFRVERSTTIKAPPERIFAMIDSLKAWTPWSPWERLDPAMRRRYTGPDSGKGAVYEWEGDSKVGKGRMEIIESSTARILIKLDFLKPFEAHNSSEFVLTPEGDATRVAWALYGPSPFLSKLMGVFFSMDRMVGRDFETGLANLKTLAEKPPG